MNTTNAARGNGFSLIEVVLAVVVLSFGMLALATVSGYVTTQIRVADMRTERMAHVHEAIEELKATPFNTLASGSGDFGDYYMEWDVAVDNITMKRVRLISHGPGYKLGSGWVADRPDTLTFTITRP